VRIALVEFSPAGGLYQFAAQLAGGMASLGHSVDLLTGPDPELEARPGVRQLPLLPTWHPAHRAEAGAALRRVRRAYRAARYVQAWWRVGRYLRRERPDVVQFAEWRFALDGAMFRLALAGARPPVVADVAHSPLPLSESRDAEGLLKTGPLLHRSLRSAYARTDVVFVLGEHSRAEFLDAFPAVTRVEVVPHGDEGVYATTDPADAGTSPETVLFFGGLSRYKGLDLLLDAFAQVRERHPSARLLVAGPVVDVDVDQLRRRADAIGGVDLRPGYVPVEQVAALVTSARLVVTPYLRANVSGVAHLAHTLGRPVVATDVGDLGEVVRDGETGLLVPAADPGRLAEAMERLLADAGLATRLGAQGRARLGEASSWRHVAERVTAVYQDLLAGPDGEPAPAVEPRDGRERRPRQPT
jgi:glycosyltransferase involved in cell wall biosynthesis